MIEKIIIKGFEDYDVFFDGVVCQVNFENQLRYTIEQVKDMIASGDIPVETL